jgi:hypothetical protein
MQEGTSVSQHLDKMEKILNQRIFSSESQNDWSWLVTGKSAEVVWVFDNHSLPWNSSFNYDWSDHFL